jgi:starch synthase
MTPTTVRESPRRAPTPARTPPSAGIATRNDAAYCVVHLTAELIPYARSGGLGEAVAGLARAQQASGIPTTVVAPLYRCVRDVAGPLVAFTDPFPVRAGRIDEQVRLVTPAAPPSDVDVVFVEHEPSFDRAGLYGESGRDYPDNAQRFATFCLAALRVVEQSTGPVVVHAHDWHAALALVYLATVTPPGRIRARVLTVHNAGYHALIDASTLVDLGLPPSLNHWQLLEWYGHVNLLKGGLVFADAVTTVSPTHARELVTNEGGFGLDGTFRALDRRLVGIRNGIDEDEWDPARDRFAATRYDADQLDGKRRCKLSVQRAFGLPRRLRTPLIAMSARIVEQKGFALVVENPGLVEAGAQLAVMGRGDRRLEQALTVMAAAHPDRVAVRLGYSAPLEHQLLAGADLLLMPSLYEPCGLTQMRAQRYGTLPIARRVGGLADTIDADVTGFLFDDPTRDALAAVTRRAVATFRDRPRWHAMMREAMRRRFGWHDPATRYDAVYRSALAGVGAPVVA